jgi:hypothetical protein
MCRERVAVTVFITALLSVLGLVATAQADPISWGFDWRPNNPVITANLPGTGGITLTDEPTGTLDGPSDLIVTNITTFSSAQADNPDQVSSGAYSLTLHLTDFASQVTAALNFSGILSGSMSATTAQIANTFTGQTTQSVLLGGNLYTVSLSSFTPPGPPDAAVAGTIAARIDVQAHDEPAPEPVPDPDPVAETPEPSTLLLAGLGLSVLGGGVWRKRRRNRGSMG